MIHKKQAVYLWQAALMVVVFLSIVNCLYGQQSANVEVWRRQKEKAIEDAVLQRLKQKPGFADDLRFSNPDFIVFVPRVEPWILGDTYNDHFQVFDTPRNDILFAVWCQATVEGALDQHIAFSRSLDRGKTWEPPRAIAGNRTIAEGLDKGGDIASWGFPLVSKSGRIYVLYNRFIPGKVSVSTQHTGVMMGIISDDDGKTWSDPEQIFMPRSIYDHPDSTIPAEWVVWQKPLRQGKNGNYLVGFSRHPSWPYRKQIHNFRTVIEFVHFDNIDADPSIKDMDVRWVQGNEKALCWIDNIEGKKIDFGDNCEEVSIVMLPDGRLFAVMRTGGGFPVWTQSRDHGETWSKTKPLLMKDKGDTILHPVSPCPIYDAKGNEAASGVYFMLAHNTFDYSNKNPWQNRGPLYFFVGRFQKHAEQPVWFDPNPKPFIERPSGNSFYSSLTVLDGKTVLWYNDQKFYLLGKVIDESFFLQ